MMMSAEFIDISNTPDFEPGRTLGDYRLERKLGQGGMGHVWLATHQFTDQRVAIKVCADPELRQTLANEARALGVLITEGRRGDFPRSIVRLYETHLSHEPPFIVMDFKAGGDLRNLLNVEKQLEPRRVLEILVEAFEALSYVHGLGITHRDLKPENILLTKEGRICITDFGLGAVTTENLLSIHRSLQTQRSSREVSGTLDYMAPEQLAGEQASPASDIYALGVIMYELLVGDRPRGLTSITRRRPTLDTAWDKLFERSFAHDPADRFATINEMQKFCRETFGRMYPEVFERDNIDDTPLTGKERRRARRERRRRWRRRTHDLLEVEKQATSLSSHEKLQRFYGYGFFGWMLPFALWSYLYFSTFSSMGFISAPADIQYILIKNIIFTGIFCYSCYLLLARHMGLSRWTITGAIACLLISATSMMSGLMGSLQYYGWLTPTAVLIFHVLLLMDVRRKLFRPDVLPSDRTVQSV
jgi:serine/threonine protein kinase